MLPSHDYRHGSSLDQTTGFFINRTMSFLSSLTWSPSESVALSPAAKVIDYASNRLSNGRKTMSEPIMYRMNDFIEQVSRFTTGILLAAHNDSFLASIETDENIDYI